MSLKFNFFWLLNRLRVIPAILPILLTGTAHGGNCNLDVPLQWTVNSTFVDNTTPTAIIGDGSAYVNGQMGVSATIKVCAGTNDAVLQAGTRNITISFAKLLASNNNTPSWATGAVTGHGLLNIRNITFVPSGYTRADEYTFTTRAGVQIPVKGSWNFRMWNPTTDASQGNDVNVSLVNSPYANSLVNVHHCPANSTATTAPCAGVIRETWFVFADTNGSGYSTQTGLPLIQVGGLVNSQQPTKPVNAGQFSIAFSYVISTLP